MTGRRSKGIAVSPVGSLDAWIKLAYLLDEQFERVEFHIDTHRTH